MADAEEVEDGSKKDKKRKGKKGKEAKELAPIAAEPALDGPTKSALWLLSIDEDLAVEIMSHLGQKEITSISEAVRNIGRTTPAQLAVIHKEFNQILALDPMHLQGGMDYLGKIASRALGEDKANQVLGIGDRHIQPSEGLDNADIDVLSGILKNEHPQITAAVVASVSSERSAELLSRFPEHIRKDVIWRVAKLSSVPQVVLDQAEKLLSAGLPSSSDGKSEVDGIRTAAQLLNQMDSTVADEILDSLESETDSVADEIRRAMFTFEDLGQLDRRGFGTLLKEVQSDQLLVALKTASAEMREQIFGSLSKRAAEMLKDDLEVMRPVRLAEVQEAQQAIVATAMQLKAEGKLVLAGSGDEFV